MCGICGIVSVAGDWEPEAAQRRVRAMVNALWHRGPDAIGLHASEGAVLGMTRLAIRGGEDGLQPLVDEASGVVVVCNGEIDNHRELRGWLAERGRPVRQATDVAVIPGMYLELGEEFASKLVGAFAIAVWDPRQRSLLLVRDRAGERPLFFTQTDAGVLFATEIASLVAARQLPLTCDQAALQRYLQRGLFASPDSPFIHLQKVKPGGRVRLDAGGAHYATYWRWRSAALPAQPPSLDAFDQVFRNAVRRQSEVDVDFGVFLSGGVDSSLIAAVARSLHPQRALKAYTLRFKVDSFDEGEVAETVARSMNLEAVPVWVEPQHLPGALSALIQTVGEPLADPAWLPTALLAKRAAQEVRVALVGEGADELFGGYPTYLGAGLAERFARLPAGVRALLKRVVEGLPISEKKMTLSFLLKRFVAGADLTGMARHQLWVASIAPEILTRLGLPPTEAREEAADSAPLLDRIQRWDLEGSLAEGLLTKADRASMSSALELRAPFLDEAVMSYAGTLPVADRVRGFTTKVFLKQYALRYLPKAIVHRRKRGLSVPIGNWLRGPLRDWATAALSNERLHQAGIRPPAALELFAEHCARKADHARALWSLIVLSEWLDWVARENASGIPNRPSAKSDRPA